MDLVNFPSLEELVDFIGDRLTNTQDFVGTFRKFFTTRHFKGKFLDLVCRTNISIVFELVIIRVISETVEHFSNLFVG